MGIATAGRIDVLNGPGIRRNDVAHPNTPYSAAPIAMNTTSRVPTAHALARSTARRVIVAIFGPSLQIIENIYRHAWVHALKRHQSSQGFQALEAASVLQEPHILLQQ